MDDLKVVNDSQGHVVGDKLLQQAAQFLRATFRAEDVVARIGGDEFAALLPEVDVDALDALLERQSQSLAAFNAAHKRPPLRLSVGGATAEKGERLAEVLKRADERMYRDKSAR